MSVDQPQPDTRKWWQLSGRFSAMYVVEITAVVGGLIATIVYAVAGPGTNWTTLSAAVMIAVASLGSGGLLGILFGVPRTGVGTDRPQQVAGLAIPSIGANTNLEQISDWLTKILVGVGLTQFAAIKREASALFRSLAPALGDGQGAAAFAGSIVIYFFVIGFLSGWLYARLRLGLAMSSADAMLELSRRADRAGDTQTAQAAKAAAKTFTQLSLGAETPQAATRTGTTELISRYEELRATLPSGPRRTSAMEDLVRQARQLTRTERFTALDVTQLFNQGTDGCRVVALALMEGDLGLADFASVLTAIRTPRSAFEQYHALTVANLLVSSLGADERTELKAALAADDVKRQWVGDTGRASLARSIDNRLGALPPAN
jgi:hypothetical protein